MAKFKWGLFSPKGLRSIEESTARINIWHGSVRSSKTTCSIVRWLEYVKNGPPGDLLMVGKTERTLKRNILDPLEEIVGGRRFKYNRGLGEVYLFGRKIYVAGANDERAAGKIQGMTLAGAYGDELSLWPESFFTMLLSRLSVGGAKFFGTINPDSPYHWLKVNYLDRAGELDLRSWHFLLDDNLNLDPAYVEALKKEYTGLWYKRFILGLWVLAEGAIYDMWDDGVHAVDIIPERFDRYLIGVDYGTNNPTVFLLIGQTGQCLYVIDEYYWDSNKTGRQKTDQEYSVDLKEFIESRWPQSVIIDPSAASFIAQLRKDGVAGIRQADNEVLEGIRNVASFLSRNRLFVYRKKCPNLLKEFASYVWDPKAQKKGEDKPIKQNDHACLIAGTLITTKYGDKPIEMVTRGDVVLTRTGWRRVLASSMTAHNAPVYKVTLSNGTQFTGTINHPVWVNGVGWRAIGNLQKGDIVCLKASALNLPGLSSVVIPRRLEGNAEYISLQAFQTNRKALGVYTKRYGSLILDLFRRAIMFTIKMAMPLIIPSKTWSVFQAGSTCVSTIMNLKVKRFAGRTLRRQLLQHLNGTDRRKAEDGILSTEKRPGPIVSRCKDNVSTAAGCSTVLHDALMTGFAQTNVNQPGAGQPELITRPGSALFAEKRSSSASTAKLKPVQENVAVVCVGYAGQAPVFNINVDGTHEYYANGVLMHNCDALRYIIQTIFSGSVNIASISLLTGSSKWRS